MTRLLSVNSVERGEVAIRIDATSPTRGVAILDLEIGDPSTATPLHWRVGEGTKPPLDLCLDGDGHLVGIQIVLQDQRVPVADEPRLVAEELGVPRFAVGDWPDDRYLDLRARVHETRLASGELCASIDAPSAIRSIRVGAGLVLGIDEGDRLVELLVGPLDTMQWQLLALAAP